MRRGVAVAALLAAACIPEEGPTMAPGSDCLECHGNGRGEENAVAWTVAGTWSGKGQHVSITDAQGKSFTIRTNEVGNFYTREPVVFPLAAAVDGRRMSAQVQYGGCNGCHGFGGGDGG